MFVELRPYVGVILQTLGRAGIIAPGCRLGQVVDWLKDPQKVAAAMRLSPRESVLALHQLLSRDPNFNDIDLIRDWACLQSNANSSEQTESLVCRYFHNLASRLENGVKLTTDLQPPRDYVPSTLRTCIAGIFDYWGRADPSQSFDLLDEAAYQWRPMTLRNLSLCSVQGHSLEERSVLPRLWIVRVQETHDRAALLHPKSTLEPVDTLPLIQVGWIRDQL